MSNVPGRPFNYGIIYNLCNDKTDKADTKCDSYKTDIKKGIVLGLIVSGSIYGVLVMRSSNQKNRILDRIKAVIRGNIQK